MALALNISPNKGRFKCENFADKIYIPAEEPNGAAIANLANRVLENYEFVDLRDLTGNEVETGYGFGVLKSWLFTGLLHTPRILFKLEWIMTASHTCVFITWACVDSNT